jgi:hypothetical protein
MGSDKSEFKRKGPSFHLSTLPSESTIYMTKDRKKTDQGTV